MINPGKVLMELKNVSKVFEHGQADYLVLEDINLKIFEGEFLAFVGPSGAGKSTLLRLVNGLISPTYGEVIYKGQAQKAGQGGAAPSSPLLRRAEGSPISSASISSSNAETSEE